MAARTVVEAELLSEAEDEWNGRTVKNVDVRHWSIDQPDILQ